MKVSGWGWFGESMIMNETWGGKFRRELVLPVALCCRVFVLCPTPSINQRKQWMYECFFFFIFSYIFAPLLLLKSRRVYMWRSECLRGRKAATFVVRPWSPSQVSVRQPEKIRSGPLKTHIYLLWSLIIKANVCPSVVMYSTFHLELFSKRSQQGLEWCCGQYY